jgi:TPR repeat protein
MEIFAGRSCGCSIQAGTAPELNFDVLTEVAETGNAQAQYEYGLRFSSGEVISMNIGLAAYYFKLAADQGLAQAQSNYGFCLHNGEGVSIDMRSAAHYFKLAAD